MKTLKVIGLIVLVIELLIGLDIVLARSNPCSAWAADPGGCGSDALQMLGR